MSEERRITTSHIRIMLGIVLILFALVILLSDKTPFAFLSQIFTNVFGFVGFWIFLPFLIICGFYVLFRKQLLKIKLGKSLWGFFIVLMCFVILSSYWASIGQTVNGVTLTGYGRTDDGAAKYMIFSNANEVFETIKANNISLFNPKLGGGYVGFILAGMINSAISPVGLNIFCWFFFIFGLGMLFHIQVKKAFAYIKNHKHVKKISKKLAKKDDDGYTKVELKGEDQQSIISPAAPNEAQPLVDNRPAIKPVYDSFHTAAPINNDYSLQKAHFSLQNDDVMKDTMVKKIEDVQAPEIPEEVKAPQKAVFEDSSFVSEPEIEVNEEKEVTNPLFEALNAKEEVYEENEPEVSPIIEPEINVAPIPSAEVIPEVVKEEPKVDFLHMPQPPINLVKNYIYPNLDLLDLHEEIGDGDKNEESCIQRTEIMNATLRNLRVGAQVVSHTVGPCVTRYDLQMNPDVSVNQVTRYVVDLGSRLGGVEIRFEQIVPGKSTSGLEIANEIRTKVGLRESIAGLPSGPKSLLQIPFGKNISGELQFANLADFPHLLVAGTTGSGKSIFIHSTILTLIMRNKPEELKLVLIDPKKVEMNFYKEIPHLLCPNISDPKKSYQCLLKLVDEMERRYNLFEANGKKDIKGFNEWAKENGVQPLPYIVVFVDEFADLMDTCKEVRDPIVRIAQKARAAGIHLVIATQRPSVNVIDGTIKANVATRVALMCASATDSMTVIGEGGAEKLLGYGDMLIDCALLSRTSKPRVQGCYVSDNEIERVCDFLRSHYQPQYDPNFLNLEAKVEEKKTNEPAIEAIDKSQSEDAQYQDIKEQIMHREYCSISFIQRSFSMGFSRAGKIFNKLVQEGIVAEKGDARGCKVLVYQPPEQQMGTIEQSTFIPDDN